MRSHGACSVAAASVFVAWTALPAAATGAPGCQAAHLSSHYGAVCALREDGVVSCWSDFDYHIAPMRNREVGRFVQVSVGFNQSCGIREDHSVACWWGRPHYNGEPEAPAGSFSELSIGAERSCGLDLDGNVLCWSTSDPSDISSPIYGTFRQWSGNCGIDEFGLVECLGDSVGPSGPFVKLATGWTSPPCGIRLGGELACWNELGQPAEYVDLPEGRFVEVSMSQDYGNGCAIDVAGKLVCFGPEFALDPPPPGTWREVSVSNGSPCAIRSDGEVVCWSYVTEYDPAAAPVVGLVSDFSAGGDTAYRPVTCTLDLEGGLSCFGADDYHQTDGLDGTFVDVSFGAYHGCALYVDHSIGCWGYGDDHETDAPEGSFHSLSSKGFGHSCALRDEDDEAVCWGLGQASLPVPDGSFERIVTGSLVSCGIREGGTVECWSYYDDIDAYAPDGSFTEVSVSGRMIGVPLQWLACGLRANKTLECWGTADAGLLDPPPGQFSAVTTAAYHACALRLDGEIACWGMDGFLLDRPDGQFVQIEAGYAHTCARRADGDLECWGLESAASLCAAPASCGDGVLDDGEGCDDDDPAFTTGDACSADCRSVGCGRPVSVDAEQPSVGDALFVFQSAVGLHDCDAAVCDVNANGTITVTDALAVLRAAVGLSQPLVCAA